MTTSLDLQFYAFFVMVLAGIGLGLLYDLFRAGRRVFRLGGLLDGLADIVCGMLGAALLGSALIIGNWGDLRVYVPVGIVLGLAFYHVTASRLALGVMTGLISLAVRLISVLAKAARKFLSIAFAPVFILWRLSKPVRLRAAGLKRLIVTYFGPKKEDE